MTSFEKTLDLGWGKVGISQQGLLSDEFYIGFELLRPPTLAELRAARKLFSEYYSGEHVWAICDRKISRARRFAEFFGLKPTGVKSFQGELYERTQ